MAGTVRSENEDALDITGPTGAGDERGKTGVVISVLFGEQSKSRFKIWQELISRGHYHVMRRKHREGPSACAAGGEQNRTGLGDERIAPRNADGASFQGCVIRKLFHVQRIHGK